MCDKHQYNTVYSAMKHLQWIRKNSSAAVTPIRVYRCKHCEGYHLTSQEQFRKLRANT